jgi:hypothetical protein
VSPGGKAGLNHPEAFSSWQWLHRIGAANSLNLPILGLERKDNANATNLVWIHSNFARFHRG